MSQAFVTLGPWGGEGGSEWNYMLSGGLKRIIVHYGTCIYSIMFQDSTDKYSMRFGTKGEHRIQNVTIDWPNEYLVSFSGRYGPYEHIASKVKYLLLETNVRSYSFGYLEEDDAYFNIPVKSGKFVGFHGRCSQLLDSIGVHLTPCSTTTPAEASGTAIAQAAYVAMGPWGGKGGEQWSYEFRGQLKQIIIDHGPLIRSISFEDSYGYSKRYGAPRMFTITEVHINSPKEYVVCLRGTYGKMLAHGHVAIRSLVIETNVKTHGPFGTESPNDVEFRIPIESGNLVGFYGRSGSDLDAIGVLVRPS